MDTENTTIVSLTVGIVSLIIGITALSMHHTRKMSELGFEKTTIIGSDCTYWKKVK